MAKFAAKGAVLAYLTGSTYTTIAQVSSFEFNDGDVATVDVTGLDSANNTREKVATWADPGPVTVNLAAYDPGIASHAWLRTNKGTSQTFKITWPDTGAATETFDAIVGGLTVTADKDNALVAALSLNRTGASTHAA